MSRVVRAEVTLSILLTCTCALALSFPPRRPFLASRVPRHCPKLQLCMRHLWLRHDSRRHLVLCHPRGALARQATNRCDPRGYQRPHHAEEQEQGRRAGTHGVDDDAGRRGRN